MHVLLLLALILGLLGKLKELEGQVAVAIGILIQVVLMILLGRIELLQRQFFYSQWLSVLGLLLCINLLDDRQIIGILILDACTIAGALVVALLVQTGRIDSLEEHLQQELETNYRVVVLDTNGFGVACGIGINLLIGWVLGVAVGKAHFGFDHTFYLLKEVLCTPEATSSQVNLFFHFYYAFVKSGCKDTTYF